MTTDKQQKRTEMVAVADDQMMGDGLWLAPGAWVSVYCGDWLVYGRIKALTPCFLFLEQAAWVAVSGRIGEYVKDPIGAATEVEYTGEEAIERPIVRVIRHTGKTGPMTTK